uniref:Restriction endonuclease n=1 Tax=uncultured bacterium IN-05 TaxID=1805583 RepID=A0A142BVR4_9BACT|nr:restriction endonuclease [uncultured bacterium IN-05]
MAREFFPQKPTSKPYIYAYSDSNPSYKGMLKVGYTSVDVEERVADQYPTLKPGEKPYTIVFSEPAVRNDGTSFMDHEVHEALVRMGFRRLRDEDGKLTEWFKCDAKNVRAAWLAVRDRKENVEKRDQDFEMRPEQAAAVEKTIRYFESINADNPLRTPKFLWNAKMRFGKTFATYQLAKKMNFKRVLVLTFKPAVRSAWHDDLVRHVDFEGWQFVTREGLQYEDADSSRPIVCFGSFQDFLGKDKNTGSIKPRNEWVHLEHWDLVVFDEYHFGAWNENSKSLFALDDDDEKSTAEASNTGDGYDESWLPIETDYYLFLSGTPFRALNSGELIEEQIFNWTYSDEQREKENWDAANPGKPNPYITLPRMVLMTYQMPDEIVNIARGGEYDSFDLNAFFEAKGKGKEAEFVFKEYVQKWLDLIRGAYSATTLDNLKQGAEKPPVPFSHVPLLNVLNHTLWYLPRVNSCHAMANLLAEPQNAFYHDYTVNVCAGAEAGIGAAALDKVQESMENPLDSKTITLTCGKLTTGVTVKPWTGIFMLTGIGTPEAYFQSAFRVQSPWTIGEGDDREIVKNECYVFDFALDRALRMVSDYSCRLSIQETGPEQKVGEFINFLPVLAYDGSAMRQVSAADILDIAMAGTSATLLARRWESALLVNVDNDTLRRLLASEEAINALMSIEGFRNLNQDIETIINKSEAVKKARKEADKLTPKEKKELSEEEKEFKSKRKEIQEKLIKFATRIPVFMYLTDYREETLKDVITQLEPGLFKKVTGLDVKDFELLTTLGVFNDGLMNDAVYKFRRYEDSSLSYTGINKHEGERVGLFDTSLSDYEYLELAQEESMVTPEGFAKKAAPASKPAKKQPVLRKDKPTPKTTAPETKAVSVSKPVKKDWVVEELESKKIESVDLRESGGCLWVVGGGELDAAMKELKELGAEFKYSLRGGKATGNRSAWWLKGYPEKQEPNQEPQGVTEEQLAAIEPGSLVFHKAFGYGEVLDIDDSYITVAFDNDDKKKKPYRKLVFPGTFYQGILQIG